MDQIGRVAARGDSSSNPRTEKKRGVNGRVELFRSPKYRGTMVPSSQHDAGHSYRPAILLTHLATYAPTSNFSVGSQFAVRNLTDLRISIHPCVPGPFFLWRLRRVCFWMHDKSSRSRLLDHRPCEVCNSTTSEPAHYLYQLPLLYIIMIFAEGD
jgi:hypothetical protein